MNSFPSPSVGGDPAFTALPVRAVAREAWRQLWHGRDELLRLAVGPLAISFVLGALLAWLPPGGGVLSLMLAELAPISLFAVNWLRLSLRGPQSVEGLGLRWQQREIRFLGRTLLLGFCIGAAMAVPLMIAARLLQVSLVGIPAVGLVMLATLSLWLRFALVFPAIAVDRPYSFARSWSDTAGHGLALLTATLLASVPIYAALLLFHAFAGGTGLATAAPLSVILIDRAGNYVAGAAWLGVLAIAFRRRTGWPQRPLASPGQSS